jgi:outer membrane protein TolC
MSMRLPGPLSIFVMTGLLLLVHARAQAQQVAHPQAESLTVDQAIALALENNHAVRIGRLEVEKSDDQIAAAKTFRLPALHAYSLVSGNLATNELQVPNPSNTLFPGVGPFFSLNVERKPTALIGASVIQPLTQQYRIGLQIKLQRLSRDVAQAKLRQQRNETIDQVKKAYYAVLMTQSALTSVRAALKSYLELDKITGDFVVQQVALKADQLIVETRLSRVQYDELELTSRLTTQKEQLNSLLGRDIGAPFEATSTPEFVAFATDLTEARKIALEKRPELQQARLQVQMATLDRRIKKSQYIPDVSAGFSYMTARNFGDAVPKNFANIGVAVSWEVFDWGRKKNELAVKDRAIEQANAGLKEAEDQVLIDVGDNLRKFKLAGQALRVARLSEYSAKENLRVSLSRYRFQTVLLSDVLQSQASVAEATHEYQKALLAFWTAKAEFERALGEDK